ncbi:uncharacterized protein LOC143202328 [Rhynchophorus ferrugineus]|uniref:uncharacterized protein LOC143202328 n=1 Tax=Rhynchophorus ferrugineus TaxID=354439 RepID=UPI003FCC98E2
MIIQLGVLTTLFVVGIAQNATSTEQAQSKQEITTTTTSAPAQSLRENEIPGAQPDVNPIYFRPQFNQGLLPLSYLEPQLQFNPDFSRLQPQLVFYGGGHGQPILINPGNPPGNFLIPQGPGPNVIVRNGPQGPLLPAAGYPKPAHIPPIEKDAEEIPTNPAKIPPLPSSKPKLKPKGKPEKLETFNEPNTPEQELSNGQFPQLKPDSTGLQPGQRFFILNGDNIFTYPYEATPTNQNLLNFRYTNVQPFPQNPPKFVPLQKSNTSPISLPNLILQNTVDNSQTSQTEAASAEDKRSIIRGPDSYARTLYPENSGNLEYRVDQGLTDTSIIEPQLFGQFRFVPNSLPNFYQFKDDFENDAVVVDASFDSSSVNDRIEGEPNQADNSISEKPASSTTEAPLPGMAQAGPQATAIAGPGGTAGSAPTATAIVGKGGLAVSSPTATAVAGTTNENKKNTSKRKA